MSRLLNKVALVSGAARGIGAAISQAFIEQGAFLVLTDIADEAGHGLAQQLGKRAVYRHLDVRRPEEWQQVVTDVLQQFGRLDIVVNNAGITGFEDGFKAHDPEHASLEDWRAVHATNLDGCFLGCQVAIRAMREQRTGSIINLSSRSGLVGIPAAAAYASSKAAIRNHTKSVALYCAEQGLAIRCNSIHPAAILTPMWEPLLGDGVDRAERMAAFVKDCPLQRFGTAEEVAALAVFLASDESTYITGAEMNIDGGMLAGTAQKPNPAS